MAKKKKEEIASDQEITGPRNDKVEENPYFTLGKWNGMTQWKCRFCPWDTLDGEGELMKHYIERHAPPPAPEPPHKVLRSDRWGNPVE